LAYLAQGADAVVFAGSLPRDVDEAFYAEAIREVNRRGIFTVLDSEGQPLSLGVQSEPFLVSPNQNEAEGLVGQEFNEDEDFILGLDAIAERGARNVLITQESGCFALLRQERTARRYRVQAPSIEPVSAVGSGDVLLAAFVPAPPAAAAPFVRGIDVSRWKGSIAWSRVAHGGYRFAFAEATNGFTADPTYARNHGGAKAAGLAFGAFHFARPAGSTPRAVVANAIAQANRFVSVAQSQTGELAPVLDLERNGGLAPPSLRAWTAAWLGEV